MTPAARFTSLLWLLAPLAAFAFLIWMAAARVHRIDYVTNLVETGTVIDPASPTGYAGGLRKLIVPEHNNDSYQWIAQTQQMLARGEWRLRHVSYDNAPAGRTVLTPSPFRWWLALVAGLDRLVGGRSPGLAVEHAALHAGPDLQLLLLLGVVAFVAWRFGTLPAALAAVAVATLFPFAGSFLAGQPDDNALVLACALGSVLPILAGIKVHAKDSAAATRWFAAAGVMGGLGLWVDVARALPILSGILVGALMAAGARRRSDRDGESMAPLPWRHWALAGALTCLAAHLVEYYPGYWGGWPGRHVHPLYGLAWLGAGEVLARLTAWIEVGVTPWRGRALSTLVPAFLAVAAAPTVLVLKGQHDFFTADLGAGRLSDLPGSPVGPNAWAWLTHDGLTMMVAATLLPLLLVVPGAWLLFRRRGDPAPRVMCALALGPVLLSLGFACVQLRTWTTLDAGLLALLVALATAAPKTASARWFTALGVLAVLAPGAWLLAAKAQAARSKTISEGEVVALVERDLAYWLARQAAPRHAIVLAPPNLATSLYFHGGQRTLGTPYGENKDGFFGSVRIAAASSADEAQAVAHSRELDYIVVPSWDNFLDDYARLGSEQADHTLMASLHRWLPPRWLQPVPYTLPDISGFEGQSVALFRVVDVQDNASALSHLAEYFVEMGMIDQAFAVADTLERSFPADFGATVARAQVSEAAGDARSLQRALQEIDAAIKRGDTDLLAWDRQVSLAIVLVQAKRIETARTVVQRCLTDVDATRLRMLTTVSLHRLLVMSRGFHLEIADPSLQALARQLLPPELRDR